MDGFGAVGVLPTPGSAASGMRRPVNLQVAGQNGAAALLGIHPSTLQSRIQELGIRVSGSG